jgi:hypothetical protein
VNVSSIVEEHIPCTGKVESGSIALQKKTIRIEKIYGADRAQTSSVFVPHETITAAGNFDADSDALLSAKSNQPHNYPNSTYSNADFAFKFRAHRNRRPKIWIQRQHHLHHQPLICFAASRLVKSSNI